MDSKFFYVDTETSGTDPMCHGITQISGEIVVNGIIVNTFDFKPRLFKGDLVEQEALEKTGMTLAEINARPMGPMDAYENFAAAAKEYVDPYNKTDKYTFVAYNAKFDWDFLQRFFAKAGDNFFGSLFWWPPVCVAVLTMNRLRIDQRASLPSMKLGVLAEAFGLPVEKDRLHDAAYDIMLTRLLHEKMGHKIQPATYPTQSTSGKSPPAISESSSC